MSRFFALFFASACVVACTDEKVVVIKADAAAPVSDAGKKDAAKEIQPPDGTETDAGLAGRRLGDKGCKVDGDCDSNLCYLADSEPDNFCTLSCTKDTAKEICVAPLAGSCNRQLVCDRTD